MTDVMACLSLTQDILLLDGRALASLTVLNLKRAKAVRQVR